MKKTDLKIIIIVGWVLLIGVGVLIFVLTQPKILKNELVDENVYLQDQEEYNLDLNVDFDSKYSPLLTCTANVIPSYLDELATNIDEYLDKETTPYYIFWKKKGKEVLTYDIENTELTIDLSEYSELIKFTSVERFVKNYIDTDIEYVDIVEEERG